MTIIVYRDNSGKKRNSWIKLLTRRTMKQNRNNLITIVGATGSGKTWSAISICELMAKEDGVPFNETHIVFTLKELMKLINSGTLQKGSKIVFDEPQVSISSKEFQSEANKIFNYLLTTFRHRNLSLFFCTPYEDLLDKSTRKMFHAKFETVKINRKDKSCKLKPKILEYNSQLQKFYEKFLMIAYKSEDSPNYVTKKIRFWSVPKPSQDLINKYEQKKLEFTTALNQRIEQRLESYDAKQEEKYKTPSHQKSLTRLQEEYYELYKQHFETKKIAKIKGVSLTAVYKHLNAIRKKGYPLIN